MSLFAESSFSATATDTSSSTFASSSSTPPTTVADSDSQHSETSKHGVITVADDAATAPPVEFQEPSPSQSPPAARRSRRARASEPVYNLSKLSGIAEHGKRRESYAAEKKRRTISGDTLIGSIEVAGDGTAKALKAGIDALNLQWSPASLNTPRTRRQAKESPRSQRASARLSGISSLSTTLSTIRKTGRKAIGSGVAKLSRELRRLQDTNEFSGVDDRPVVHTIWANGKYVDPNAPPAEPACKNPKVDDYEIEVSDEEDEEEEDKEPITNTRQRRVKKYLEKGLYAGQNMPLDVLKGITIAEKRKLASLPELAPTKRQAQNKTMPSPIYTGLRMLIAGRDFRLPFDVCNPLPPGQPKPDEWKKMTKNRFIGDSKDYWRKMPHMHDLSKCVCKPDDGCGDNCQNRIMLYECDAGNCNVGKELCTNRSFADLAARRAKGGKYCVGVEVIKTSDRGYGVRSNRCFKANQIIMEYTGEIITEEECERRMNEVYKNNECYYLMSFDQNMIIDATTGSIARFVNHSCDPNCRMVKWIVAGQPRMALFAGDRPIMTGDELTYDYNFDPFSAKNVQKCLCGSTNCRGILGPRQRDVKPKVDLKSVKATVKAGKRKLQELMGDETKDRKTKKRKVAPTTGLKRSISSASLKAAKGAATALKKSVSSITVKGRKTSLGTKSVQRRASTTVVKKTAAKVVRKTSSAGRATNVPSRASSMTIVAKTTPVKSKKVMSSPSTTISRKSSTSSFKRVIKPTAKAMIRMVPRE